MFRCVKWVIRQNKIGVKNEIEQSNRSNQRRKIRVLE